MKRNTVEWFPSIEALFADRRFPIARHFDKVAAEYMAKNPWEGSEMQRAFNRSLYPNACPGTEEQCSA